MRGKATHKHAFRSLAEDQRSWADDPRYSLGLSWCGERASLGGTLWTAEEMTPEAAKRADCPKCAAAMGAAKLAGAYAGRVKLVALSEEERKACDDYSVRYAKSVYEFHLDGTLRGYIIAAAGFGKGWSLHRVAGELDFARVDGTRLVGDRISGDRPTRYGTRQQIGELWPIHYAARDAMAAVAVRLAEAGDLPTPAEQAERKAASDAKRAEEAAQRERDRAAAQRAREAREQDRAERMTEARQGLASLLQRSDLTNAERAGVVSAAALLGLNMEGDAT
jgi:hypothetical protein